MYVDALTASADEVEAMRKRLQLLADELGGDFLGNGFFTPFAPTAP